MLALSPAEQKVFNLLVRGLSNKQISEKINIKEKSVKFHLTRIYRKYGVSSRSQLLSLYGAQEFDKVLNNWHNKNFSIEKRPSNASLEYDMMINYNPKLDIIVLYEKNNCYFFKSQNCVKDFVGSNSNSVKRALSKGFIKGFRVGIIKGANYEKRKNNS